MIEATEESIQGIGEGFKHGTTLLTGMGVGTAQSATTSVEESIQSAARETPRAMQDVQRSVQETGESIDATVEDTKQKGLGTKISEKLEGAKEEARGLSEGFKPNVHELRKKPADQP